ncbi:MAG: ABC transporter permease [Acetobacteraceae bacterium]|nr:ABC transporter permease [Acetobacteraceae bacterium]
MTQYLIRRLLLAIPSLLGISVILFTVLALAPGDPFEELATNPAVPPEVRLQLRASLGLDDPIHVRYIAWLTAMLRGEWGFSFVSRVDVDQLILQRLPTTLIVIGSSQVVALAIALPVGILAATRPYSLFDKIANTLAFVGFSPADLLHRAPLHPVVLDLPRLAPLRVPDPDRGDRVCLALGAREADHHAGDGAWGSSRGRPGRASSAPPCST